MKGHSIPYSLQKRPPASSWVLVPKERLIVPFRQHHLHERDIPSFFNKLELSLEHMLNNLFLESILFNLFIFFLFIFFCVYVFILIPTNHLAFF